MIASSVLLVAAGIAVYTQKSKNNRKYPKGTILVQSEAFKDGGFIPEKYTADGENISPPLTIENVPENAKSLVLIVDDPDAPNGIFTHWLAWNLDPKTHSISENAQLNAHFGTNSFNKLSYGGPCPPSGTHHYYFKIYALDTILTLEKGAIKQTVKDAIKGHIIAFGTLMGKYSKKY